MLMLAVHRPEHEHKIFRFIHFFIVRESNIIATYVFYSEIGQFKRIGSIMSWAVNFQMPPCAASE